MKPGVQIATKKDNTVYYRSGITYNSKHISLGSYASEEDAHQAYLAAKNILLSTDFTIEKCIYHNATHTLPFEKEVTLINLRDNGIYIATPIYLRKNYFEYHLSPDICLKFDIDDLFYYSSHKIMKRQGHLFVADFGSQVSIISRHGLKPYSVLGRDYEFINDDAYDFRRNNIEIINRYNGVRRIKKEAGYVYKAVIHIDNNYVIGHYASEDEAAIAYNKAIDILQKKGVKKNFTPNYLDGLSPKVYAKIYTEVKISPKIENYSLS